MNCIFCKIIAGQEPSSIVYQDETCTAIMDIQPINPGHVLILPNNHAACLADLDQAIAAHLFPIAQRIAAAIRCTEIRCEGINLLLADGEAAGQEVFHVHLHVLPRYNGDGFGLTFSDEYLNLPHRSTLNAVAAQIRNEL